MRYELSTRIQTDQAFRDVMNVALGQFQLIARSAVVRGNEVIQANGIESTFGSINRSTEVIVSGKELPDGWLIVADVKYAPSFWFWLFLIIGLFSAFFWIVPILFYLGQKNSVRDAVERSLSRVRDEMQRQVSAPQPSPARDHIADLERLAGLKDRGVITDEEFAEEKRKILGGQLTA